MPALVVAAGLVALAMGRAPAGAEAIDLADGARVLERVEPAPETPLALIEKARATSDPRWLGRAQAKLGRWWDEPSPPHDVLVLRATIKQSLHEFDAALVDLAEALRQDPDDGQAWLTQATLLRLRGDAEGARASCEKLERLASELVVAACLADEERLISALGTDAEGPAVRSWALTILAELEARGDRAAWAENHFRQALALTPGDGYLLGAWSDFLLDAGRPGEVVALLDGRDADQLLLRRAIAAKRLGSPEASSLSEELGRRFAAGRARGDRIHLREEARWLLELGSEPRAALAVARESWKVQREPADARLLVDASLAWVTR